MPRRLSDRPVLPGTGYAGASSIITGGAASATLSMNGHSDCRSTYARSPRAEQMLDARKNKAAARTLVATLVSERLALQNGGAKASAPAATPVGAGTPRTPQPDNKSRSDSPSYTGVPPPASLPSGYALRKQIRAEAAAQININDTSPTSNAGSRPASAASGTSRPPPPNIVAKRPPTAPPAGATTTSGKVSPAPASENKPLQQPVWRPGGQAPVKPSPSVSEKPRSWTTRDELVEMLAVATRRADAAEEARDAALSEAQMLRDEMHLSEVRETDAINTAAATKAASLTIGENEVRLRRALEEQEEQLAKAVAEEAAAREAAHKAEEATIEAEAKLEASEERCSKLSQRFESADRFARDAREKINESKATTSQVESLKRELAEANNTASLYRTQAQDEATAKRTVGMQLKEAKAALAKLREESHTKQRDYDATQSKEANVHAERLNALRHVNQVMESKIRSLFSTKNKVASKATTLQEAVQMLTDEYVVVVDQLRACQSSLQAEQAKVASLETTCAAYSEEARVAIEKRREAEASESAAIAEVLEVDATLVPRLTQDAVEAAHLRMDLVEAQRHGSQHAASAARRVQAAEAGLAKAQDAAVHHEEEVALLKRRLNQSLKRIRELQGTIDEMSNRRWVPTGTAKGAAGGRGGGGGGAGGSAAHSASWPPSPSPGCNRSSSARSVRATASPGPPPRPPGATSNPTCEIDEDFAENCHYYEDVSLAAASSPSKTLKEGPPQPAPSPRAAERRPVAFTVE